MFQLHYPVETRDALREHFEQRGVSGHGDGIILKGAWVSKSRHAFALFHLQDEDSVQQLCSDIGRFGELSFEPVIDVNQIL